MNRLLNPLKKGLIGTFILASGISFGQDTSDHKQELPLSVSLTNHSWAFPFSQVFRMGPIYPGASVETAYYYRNKEKLDLLQTAQIGGFYNSSSGSALYFNSDLQIKYTANFGLTADLGLGLGYLHSFYPSTTHVQTESGTYETANKAGVGALSANLSLGLGYDLSKKTDLNISPFIRYQWIGSTAYWSLLNIRPNGLLHLGVQFKPFNQ